MTFDLIKWRLVRRWKRGYGREAVGRRQPIRSLWDVDGNLVSLTCWAPSLLIATFRPKNGSQRGLTRLKREFWVQIATLPALFIEAAREKRRASLASGRSPHSTSAAHTDC